MTFTIASFDIFSLYYEDDKNIFFDSLNNNLLAINPHTKWLNKKADFQATD